MPDPIQHLAAGANRPTVLVKGQPGEFLVPISVVNGHLYYMLQRVGGTLTQGSRGSLEIRRLNFEDGTNVLQEVLPDVVGISDPISTNGELVVVRVKRKN